MARGAYILGCQGPVLTTAERRFFRAADPWGFILFARNLESVEQARRLTGELRDAVGWEAPILIDQEGGRVERMGPPHWRHWVAPLDEMRRGGADAMRLRYQIIGTELLSSGIDVNCAPLADIARADTHPFLRNRCYGENADTVTKAARAVAEGLLSAGVLPVLKHIPGHGLSAVDTHLDLPRVSASRADLEAADFAPFRALSDLGLGMTAHLVFDAIDPQHPATQSVEMIRMIRRDIGFDGVLMTDDISMEALAGTPAERGAAALAAGCDLILHCNGKMVEMEAIAGLGPMSPKAKIRSDRSILQRKSPHSVDIRALEAEYQTLVGEALNG